MCQSVPALSVKRTEFIQARVKIVIAAVNLEQFNTWLWISGNGSLRSRRFRPCCQSCGAPCKRGCLREEKTLKNMRVCNFKNYFFVCVYLKMSPNEQDIYLVSQALWMLRTSSASFASDVCISYRWAPCVSPSTPNEPGRHAWLHTHISILSWGCRYPWGMWAAGTGPGTWVPP